MFDCEFDIDPSFFSARRHAAWVLAPEDDPASLQIEEAFTLLGPHLGGFGDFMMQYLPRYLWADMSGELPHVPVLSSSRLPQTIRDALGLVVPAGVEIIEVDPLQPVHVRSLWCGSSLTYAPAREVMDERYSTLHTYPSPELIVPVVSELNRRVAPHVVRDRGPKNVFLARQPWRWSQLLNAPEIEAVAAELGFTVVYPDELTFVEQVNLVANARRVVAPEGSALFLCYFASPATQLLILENAVVEGGNIWRAFFPNCEPTGMAGTVVDYDDSFPHRSSYRIDPRRFREVLREWL
jgi:capsular polysaccharide biosynthesis protein